MKVKCDYCGAMIDEDYQTCPQCGGPLNGVNRMASEQPKTIAELQEWYHAHRLPPEEVTRFFIGKNVQEAKAFGIYRNESGDYVVYKNKADGTRAIRYEGSDQAYAVNELYQRLRSEIADQQYRIAQESAPSSSDYTFRPLYKEEEYPDYSKMDAEEERHDEDNGIYDHDGSGGTLHILVIALLWLITFAVAAGIMNGNGSGGYNGGDSGYYSNYDDDDDDSGIGWSYHSNSNSNHNSNSNWWDSGRSNDSWDWDSDSSWDSGWDSWDSGSTDWSSDW